MLKHAERTDGSPEGVGRRVLTGGSVLTDTYLAGVGELAVQPPPRVVAQALVGQVIVLAR